MDAAVCKSKRADWRGNPPIEQETKRAIYNMLKDEAESCKNFPDHQEARWILAVRQLN